MRVSDTPIELFGVTLIGATSANLHKIALTLLLIAIVVATTFGVRRLLRLAVGSRSGTRLNFWARQAVAILAALLLVFGIGSIWFENPATLAGAVGLIGAGVAFALQRVITAFAGYLVILRGKTFSVGDRIVMGGVRGDVIGLSFMQTRIMEMGQSPKEQSDAPSMWVHSRQFTGRIVTVTNDKIFDEPVYNYTDEFPYVWDEISLPVRYGDDRDRAEAILVKAAQTYALTSAKIGEDAVSRLDHRFGINAGSIDPRVYWRLTDNWLELTVRFLAPDHGVREIKDKMSRDILTGLEAAGMGIASTTFEITAIPALTVKRSGSPRPDGG